MPKFYYILIIELKFKLFYLAPEYRELTPLPKPHDDKTLVKIKIYNIFLQFDLNYINNNFILNPII